MFSNKSIIIDSHNGGPIAYNLELINNLNKYKNDVYSRSEIIRRINLDRLYLSVNSRYNEYKSQWYKSGIDVGVRTMGIFGKVPFSIESILYDISLAIIELEFLEWIGKIETISDIYYNKEKGKKSFIWAIESLECAEKDLSIIDLLYYLGIRIVQPIYNNANFIGSGCYDKVDSGLTQKGKEVINRLNKLHMIIDISHIGDVTSKDIINNSKLPVIATHTFCRNIHNTPRGKNDEILKEISLNDGYIGITINPALLFSNYKKGTIDEFIKHLEHSMEIAGEDKVGVGSDWSGDMPKEVVNILNADSKKINWSTKLENYSSYADWNNISSAIKNAFGDTIAEKILGVNFLNFFIRYYNDQNQNKT